MKKLLTILIFAVLCGGSAMAYDFSAVCESGQTLYYNITSTSRHTVELYGGSNVTGNLTIPEIVEYNSITYSVTSIGNNAFENCSGLTGELTIPNSVTSIDYHAFFGCSGLTGELTIPNSVTSIGESAFSRCSGLISVSLGNSVTSIKYRAFYSCSGLTGELTIPNSVTSIGMGAFRGCSGLISVSLGNSVTSIGHDAFYETGWYNNQPNGILYLGDWCIGYKGNKPTGELTITEGPRGIADFAFCDCFGLTSVIIPNSVTSIGENAFRDCSGLISVSLGNSVTSIGYSAFNGTGWYYNQPDGILYLSNWCLGYKGDMSVGDLTIIDGTRGIGDYAFYDCSVLTSVTIPNSVTSIGNVAFYNCNGLTSVIIPNSVTSIGVVAFMNCSGLTGTLTIPESVTSIGDEAFSYCSGLTTVTIGNSVTSIGEGAFSVCSGLTSVTIGNSVTSIGGSAFNSCTSLASVTIPNSVTSIGSSAFSYCSGIETMIVESGNSIYDSRNNCNAIIETSSNNLLFGCKNTIIPDSVITIGESAFAGCIGLTSVTIPNSVTSIGSSTFRNCIGLTSVSIGNSVTSIGKSAFEYCIGLTSVTIPNSVTSIGNKAFYLCYGLEKIYSNAENPATIGTNTFSSAVPIFVPCGAENNYLADEQWGSLNINSELPHFVTLNSNDEAMGTAVLLNQHCSSSTAVIEARPRYGYNFVHWNDGNTDNPRTITVTEDVIYTATFEVGDGIEENNMESKISLFPNPATDILNITYSETISEIEIVNTLGQVVKRIEVNADNAVCDVEDLTSGVYVVRIRTLRQAQGAAMRKFIKE